MTNTIERWTAKLSLASLEGDLEASPKEVQS